MRRRLLILFVVVLALVASFALVSKATQAGSVHMGWQAQAHLIDNEPVDGQGGGG